MRYRRAAGNSAWHAVRQRDGCASLPQGRKRLVPEAVMSLVRCLCLASGAALAGCALTQPSPAERAHYLEPMLSAAGFRLVPADTPQKIQRLAALAPLKVSYYAGKDGKTHYWFADPDHCHCFYVGDEAAYQKYQDLRLQARIAREKQEAAEENYEASQQMQMEMTDPFDGGAFGPGFGIGY